MLLERLLILKRLDAETTFRFVNSRIKVLLESLGTAKQIFALLTRYSVRRLLLL